MTDYSKRTPGPWEIHVAGTTRRGYDIQSPGGERLIAWDIKREGDAAFIVACENAMTAAGIVNPEAVPEIVAELNKAADTIYLLAGDGEPADVLPGYANDTVSAICAALAKAREAKA